MIKKYLLIYFFPSFFIMTAIFAQPTDSNPESSSHFSNLSVATSVEKRAEKEDKILPNNFSIAFYKPTYILPYYYTASPYNRIYQNATPNNEGLNKSEFKYQISLKVPLWKNIFNSSSSLYLAYTQLSYWQLYNKTAFFRETDYEPELFLTNEINLNIGNHVKFNFFNIGLTHQSNGFGTSLERSWNRVYVDIISSLGPCMLSLKPWYVFHDSTMREYNPNIAHFLGYGRALFAFKYGKQVFSLQGYNLIESGGRRASAELTWSFPLTPYISGYLQGFSGYGQSLIEYNHRTNSVGVGLSLSNWI